MPAQRLAHSLALPHIRPCSLADRVVSEVPTGVGARTGIWYPERDLLYVAVPATTDNKPKLMVFEPL